MFEEERGPWQVAAAAASIVKQGLRGQGRGIKGSSKLRNEGLKVAIRVVGGVAHAGAAMMVRLFPMHGTTEVQMR